jgi:hypothetical protein
MIIGDFAKWMNRSKRFHGQTGDRRIGNDLLFARVRCHQWGNNVLSYAVDLRLGVQPMRVPLRGAGQCVVRTPTIAVRLPPNSIMSCYDENRTISTTLQLVYHEFRDLWLRDHRCQGLAYRCTESYPYIWQDYNRSTTARRKW